LNLAMKQGKTVVPTLKFIVESLGAHLSVRSFDTRLTAYLGGIYLHHIDCKGSYFHINKSQFITFFYGLVYYFKIDYVYCFKEVWLYFLLRLLTFVMVMLIIVICPMFIWVCLFCVISDLSRIYFCILM